MYFKKMGKKALIVIFWLLIWELVAFLVHNSFLLVTPREVLKTLGANLMKVSFYETVLNSLVRVVGGFFLALFLGVLSGCLSYRYKLLEELLSPLVFLMKTVPVAAFVVLLLFWWGAGKLPFVISFLVAFPSIYIADREGMKAVDVLLGEVFWLYRIPLFTKLFYLYRYSVGAYIGSSLPVALGLCFKAGIAAEIIGMADDTIGGSIYFSKISFETAELLAWTVTIVAISFLFEKGIFKGIRLFDRWQPACRVMPYRECPGDLTIEKLSLAYGEKDIISDYSAFFEKNQISYIRWESGKGKTTLFRAIAGLKKPKDGRISSPERISMLFQEDRLLEKHSPIKNVELVCGDRQLAEEKLAKVLPKDCLLLPVASLSGGMKRRVALVRAMVAPGDIVLLDEPFTGMDEETIARVMEFIEEEKRGRAVLIATHIN